MRMRMRSWMKMMMMKMTKVREKINRNTLTNLSKAKNNVVDNIEGNY